ncbi:MAG: hypothetical protein AMXMBFR74_24110 [Parvibaculum sp.]|uniref:HNH endonuclease n=1 Tax=Parvibaculum sp. TaxID=2024848 RepID=UPI0035B8E0F3
MAYPGYPFIPVDEQTKRAVWNKGIVVPNYDPNSIRKDICGNWMVYDEHGGEGDYGWEIDHIYPRARGGGSTLDNLQPLWWRNNRRKGDNYPWSC